MRFRPSSILDCVCACLLGAALACSGGGGGGNPPTPAPTIASFTAAPATITAGGASTLSWSTSGASTLSIDQGVGAVTGTSKSVSPAATTTYTLTASNAGGSATATAVVTVVPAPAIQSFTASPAVITAGGSTTLAWTATGATSFSIDQGVGTVTGSSKVLSPAATTTYTLTASNAAGSTTSATATVTVVPAPVITSFAANPAAISTGQSSTLSWTTTGATALSLDQGIGPVTGTSKVVSPAATTTYTLTATNAAGSTAGAQATVTVSARTTQVTLHVKVADTVTNATWAAMQDGDANAPWVLIAGTAGIYSFQLQDPSGMFSVALAYQGGPVLEAVTQVLRATVADLDALAGPAAPPSAAPVPVARDLYMPVTTFDADTLNSLPLKTLSGTFSGLNAGHEMVDIYAYNKTLGIYRNLGYQGNGAWSMNVPPGTYDVAFNKISFPVTTPLGAKFVRGVDLNSSPAALPAENTAGWLADGPATLMANLPAGAGSFFGRASIRVDGSPQDFTLSGIPMEGLSLGYSNTNPLPFLLPPAGVWGPQDVGQIHIFAFSGDGARSTEAFHYWNPAFNPPPTMSTLPDLPPAPSSVTDTPTGSGYCSATLSFPGGGIWSPAIRQTFGAQQISIQTRTPGQATMTTDLSAAWINKSLEKYGPSAMDTVGHASLPGLPTNFRNPCAIAHYGYVHIDQAFLLPGYLQKFQKTVPVPQSPSSSLRLGINFSF